jgi:hypothetical protein
MLMAPLCFGTSSLLRLERAREPGIWEEVPANQLPITEEGAFLDKYGSPTGYYRMRIDPAQEWVPLNMPLADVPTMAVKIAQELLDSSRNVGGDNSWEDASLGPIAFPIYSPGIEGPTYMEFALLSPQPEPPDMPFQTGQTRAPSPLGICSQVPRGFILVSLTEDDRPIVDFATEGTTHTECLRRMAKSSALKIVKTDEFNAAENSNGQLVAYLGPPPVYFPEEALQYCDKEYESYVNPQGQKFAVPPPFTGTPYPSYEAFKEDYLKSGRLQEARKRRREAAKPEWDIWLNRLPEVITIPYCVETAILKGKGVKSLVLADPTLATFKIVTPDVLIHGIKIGDCAMHVVFTTGTGADYHLVVSQLPLSPEQPIGWSSWDYSETDDQASQRDYEQEDGGDCASGCGATAWAMLYGWWDHSGRNEDLIEGVAPLNNNDAVRDCIWYIVPEIETYCVGDQGATNPWDMIDGYTWADHRGSAYDVSDRWVLPCFAWTTNRPRDKAINEIKDNDRPVIVGFGCASPHYAVAYRYRYRRYTSWGVTWDSQRRLRCNMGWGGTREWKDAEDVWYACTATF